MHLGKFNPEGSDGLSFLLSLCPCRNLTRESFIILAQVFSILTSISFPRDFSRRRDLVIKWFDDNLDQIRPFSPLFILEAEVLQQRPADNNFGSSSSSTSDI
jgi:hypothetical protein